MAVGVAWRRRDARLIRRKFSWLHVPLVVQLVHSPVALGEGVLDAKFQCEVFGKSDVELGMLPVEDDDLALVRDDAKGDVQLDDRRDLRPKAYERAEEGADGSRVTVPLICGKTGHLSGVGGGVDAGTQSRGDAHGAVVNEREREE